MTDLRVGDKIPDAAAMDGLPVGTAVTLNGSPKLLTKHHDGWAQHRDYGGRHTGQEYWWQGMEIVSLPEAYMGPEVGAPVTTMEHLTALPGDAVIADPNDGRRRLQKIGERTYQDPDYAGQFQDLYHGGTQTAEWVHGNYPNMVVESLPDATFETVPQFQWRFRDLSITGAERAQGSHDSATRVLNRIPIEFTPSVGMRITSQFDRSNLPEGSRVYIGRPEDPDNFGLFVKERGGTWRKILGTTETTATSAVAVIVDALPDKTEPDDWMTAVPDEAEREAVALMKRQVWQVGFREKTDRGWCDEFERIMLRGGLSDKVAKIPMPGGVQVGDVVTPEQAAVLPLGTVLRVDNEDGFTIFLRVDGARNAAGTRRVVTTNGFGRHYAQHMLVASEGNGEATVEMVPSSVEEMNAMPVGTCLIHLRRDQRLYRYVKTTDQRWVQVNTLEGTPVVPGGVYRNGARDFNPGRNCTYRYDFEFAGQEFM